MDSELKQARNVDIFVERYETHTIEQNDEKNIKQKMSLT